MFYFLQDDCHSEGKGNSADCEDDDWYYEGKAGSVSSKTVLFGKSCLMHSYRRTFWFTSARRIVVFATVAVATAEPNCRDNDGIPHFVKIRTLLSCEWWNHRSVLSNEQMGSEYCTDVGSAGEELVENVVVDANESATAGSIGWINLILIFNILISYLKFVNVVNCIH